MSAVKNIQEKLGRIKLKKERKKLNRNVKAFNIEKASTIGVLYNATNRGKADLVKKFIQHLKEERKEVISLGYIDSKDASDMVTPILNYHFFDRSHLTKMMTPNHTDINNFINTPFSILIDLNISECFPLEYVSTLSKAKFKVGAAGSYRDNACDMVIDINNKKQVNFLIIQVRHYLTMIKN